QRVICGHSTGKEWPLDGSGAAAQEAGGEESEDRAGPDQDRRWIRRMLCSAAEWSDRGPLRTLISVEQGPGLPLGDRGARHVGPRGGVHNNPGEVIDPDQEDERDP